MMNGTHRMNKSLSDLISHARPISRAQERAAEVSAEEARPGFIDRVLSARGALAEPTRWVLDCEKQLRWAFALCVVITAVAVVQVKQRSTPIDQVAAPWLEMEGSRNLHWGDL
jgi:hypothetical protein